MRSDNRTSKHMAIKSIMWCFIGVIIFLGYPDYFRVVSSKDNKIFINIITMVFKTIQIESIRSFEFLMT